MLRQIYYCDFCQIEIGERCKIIWHHSRYVESHGEDLHTDYHFCSRKCEIQGKNKIQIKELKENGK